MILNFKMKSGNCPVTDTSANTQYIAQFADEGEIIGGVYDEFCASRLVDIKWEEGGYIITAFDTPIGVLKKHGEGFSSDDGRFTISYKNDRYIAAADGETAIIAKNGNAVSLKVQENNIAILFIAMAMIIVKTNVREEKERYKIKKTAAKGKFKKAQIIVDRFLIALGYSTRNAASGLKKSRKVKGKIATLLSILFVFTLLLAVSFSFVAVLRQKTNLSLVKTVATVEKQVSRKVAYYSVDNITYRIDDVPASYNNYDQFTVYYKTDHDGNVTVCRQEKYSITVWIALAIVSFVISLICLYILRLGVPKTIVKLFKRKEPDLIEE